MAVDATQPPFTVKFANNPPFPYAQFLEWGFGESAPIPSIIAVSPTHLYSPGKYFTLTQSTRNCNGYIVDTKNAGIAFVPYIQDLSVTNQTTNAAYAQYTRTISGGNLVFNKMGNYLIPARQKILIKANVYGFVDYLKLMVLDNAGNTVLTSDGVYNTTDNTYHFNILSQQLRTGVNKLKFTGHFTISSVDYPIPSGTDPLASERAGHDIYNRTDNISLSSYPAKLNTWNITNWAAYTGPDDNYSITVEAPLLSDQYMEIILDSDCTNLIFKATFYIHSVPDGSKLDFGDKITTLVSPNTVVNHTYTRDPDIISKYLVKLSDPSGQPIMSRLIYFSIR
jgi:hypothetical protein